jgi:hypothetical protein
MLRLLATSNLILSQDWFADVCKNYLTVTTHWEGQDLHIRIDTTQA